MRSMTYLPRQSWRFYFENTDKGIADGYTSPPFIAHTGGAKEAAGSSSSVDINQAQVEALKIAALVRAYQVLYAA